jgi:hypothetical protein
MELQYNRSLRRSLIHWVQYLGLKPAKHHRMLLEALQSVAEGQIDRLAIFMPPGSAKSTYASILFPPWYLGHHLAHSTASSNSILNPGLPGLPGLGTCLDAADHLADPSSGVMGGWARAGNQTIHARLPMDRARNILAASHTTELATRFGRRVRNLIQEHGHVLGLEMSEDSAAADRWALAETCGGSEYYAAGVDTGIAGFRADLAIIDDPVRSRADADSSTTRERHWEWYKSDLLPRLRPGAAIVLIMTRWHEDDLAGRILAEAERGSVTAALPLAG